MAAVSAGELFALEAQNGLPPQRECTEKTLAAKIAALHRRVGGDALHRGNLLSKGSRVTSDNFNCQAANRKSEFKKCDQAKTYTVNCVLPRRRQLQHTARTALFISANHFAIPNS